MQLSTAQRIGRIAELHVEKLLTEHGWLCGNFNVSVSNSCAWDLCAKKGDRTRVVRVKGSSSADVTWNQGKDKPPLPNFHQDDESDWSAIVINVGGDRMEAYFLPTSELYPYLAERSSQIDEECGGTPGKRLLHLHFRTPKGDVNFKTQYGFHKTFEKWKQWD